MQPDTDTETKTEYFLRKIADLELQIRLLEREVAILRTRPDVTFEDVEHSSPNMFIGVRETRRLIPGHKYKLHLKYELNGEYHFETPMMLVETPDVRVHTAELHTYQHDDILPVRMENKE